MRPVAQPTLSSIQPEGQIITADIPHYNAELTLQWSEHCNKSLLQLFQAIMRAAHHSGVTIRGPRFSALRRPPVLRLVLDDLIASIHARVGSVLTPGCRVHLLTHEEIMTGSSPQIISSSMAGIQRDSDMASAAQRALSQLDSVLSDRSEFSSPIARPRPPPNTPVQRESPAIRTLLEAAQQTRRTILHTTRTTTIRRTGEGEAPPGDIVFDAGEEDDLDEEYVMQTHFPTSRTEPLMTALRSLMMGGGRDAEGLTMGHLANLGSPDGVPTLAGGVKTVITHATFQRVCPIVTTEEIAAQMGEGAVMSLEVEEDDTIGGPQDAGLGACSICLSLLVNRSRQPAELRRMPHCVHQFHAHCLAEWLTHNAITCPSCREPAVTERKDYGFLGIGGTEEFTPALATSSSEPTRHCPHCGSTDTLTVLRQSGAHEAPVISLRCRNCDHVI